MYRGKVCGYFGCLLIISCMVVFVVGSVFFTGSSVFASSQYDTYLKKADILTIKSNDNSNPCTNDYKKDWSTSWTQLIQDPQYWSYGGQSSKQSEYWTAFQDSIDTGDWIALSQRDSHNNALSATTIKIIYSPKGMIADWTINSTSVFVKAKDGSNLYEITFQVFQAGGCQPKAWQPTRVAVSNIGKVNNGGSGTYESLIALFVVSNTDMNYPPGYEGVLAPTEWSPPVDNKLRFTWSVDKDGNVSGIDTRNINSDVLDHCGVTWTLYNSTMDWQKGSVINTVTQPQYKIYNYSTIPQGFYILEEKPNYCVPFIDNGKIHLGTQNIEFKGLNIGGMSDKNKESSTPFNESNPLNQFGLTKALQAPLIAIQKLATVTCSPITIPLFNGTSATAACPSQYYQSTIGTFFTFWQMAITGMVAYAVSIGIIGHTKRLLNPDDDRIEVVDL